MMEKRRVILDTDIGTDPDDAMTLVQAQGSSIELLGATLGYGPTLLRKGIAKRYIDSMGWDLPLHSGLPKPLSGRDIWLSGREGKTLGELPVFDHESKSAVDFIAESLRFETEPVTLLCLSPLTNIAQFLEMHANLLPKVKELVVMGGEFVDGALEHNFACDSIAAQIVMSSALPITVVGLDATTQLKLDSSDIEKISQQGPTGEILAREIYDWWDFWGEAWSVPHDPIALVALQHPELFEFSPYGQVTVATSGVNEGQSIFSPGPGRTRYVTSFDVDAVSTKIMTQILKGCNRA
jgi:purine nucleosidase